MTSINYIKGDATRPIGEGTKYLVHICSNGNVWGKGFVLTISRKWKKPEKVHRSRDSYPLGAVTLIKVEKDLYIGNMIAQNGINRRGQRPIQRVDYEALRSCFRKIRKKIGDNNISIHMPRIGTGLGCGKWEIVEKIITKELQGLKIYVYTL